MFVGPCRSCILGRERVYLMVVCIVGEYRIAICGCPEGECFVRVSSCRELRA